MSVYHRSTAKSRILQEYREKEEELAAALSSQMSPQGEGLESEKRVRREIANSNERRRMQSINAGFQLLRSLIPHNECEKLSKVQDLDACLYSQSCIKRPLFWKAWEALRPDDSLIQVAAILQQTTDYIKTLMHDKAKILEQNAYYRKLLSEVSRRCNIDFDLDVAVYSGSPPRKRKKRDTESSDEGIAADFEDSKYDDFKRELTELRQQLDKERHLRLILENRSPHALDMHQYAEKVYHTEHQIKMHSEKEKLSFEEDKPELNVPHTPVDEIKPADRDEVLSFTPLRIDLDPDLRVSSASPHRSDSSDSVSSTMSRRKLETLVEAIQYVEGEDNNMDQRFSKSLHNLTYLQTSSVPNSEESEKDSSITSDQDDARWECSGRDSPTIHQQYVRLQSAQNLQCVSSLQKHSPSSVVVTSSSYTDKYPAAVTDKYGVITDKYPAVTDKYPAVTNVLQGNMSQPQYLYRPAVIVHKS